MMSNWWSRTLDQTLTWIQSPYGRSALTIAIASSTLTAFFIFAGQDVHRRTTRRKLRDEIEDDVLKSLGKRPLDTLTSFGSENLIDEDANDEVVVDDSLITEQLARNIAFLGTEGVAKIRKSFVIIVGMGGVRFSFANSQNE